MIGSMILSFLRPADMLQTDFAEGEVDPGNASQIGGGEESSEMTAVIR
jgi:hypothetical protein